MVQFLSRRSWESKSALAEHLNAHHDRALLLGEDSEAPRAYYSFSAASTRGSVEIGIVSSDLGAKPIAILLGQEEYMLVCHDFWLRSVEMSRPAVIKRQRLGGLAFEFLPVEGDDEIIVLHEIGMLRVSRKAEVKWSVDAYDIVTGWTNDGKGNIILTVMDGPALMVSLSSGSTVAIPEARA